MPLPKRRPASIRDRIVIVLSRGPNYERALVEQIKRSCPWWQKLLPGFLYLSILRDMELEGTVMSYEKNDAPALRGGRPRRYYAIKTPEDTRPFSTIS